MDLQTFFDKYGIAAFNELARACGSDEQYFYQLRTGRRAPSMALAKRIEKESGGKVKRRNLRPADFAPV